jgi:hypothetical protein
MLANEREFESSPGLTSASNCCITDSTNEDDSDPPAIAAAGVARDPEDCRRTISSMESISFTSTMSMISPIMSFPDSSWNEDVGIMFP